MARSGVIYGGSGRRKTTQVKQFAHYIAERTGKATLLLSLDGGGWSPCQPEVDAGMIVPFFCDPSLVPLPTLRKISQGYWPKDASLPANEINLVPTDWKLYGGMAVEGWTSITSAAMRYLPDKGINVGGEEREKLGGFSQTIQVDGAARSEVFRSNTRGDYGFVQNFLYGFVMNCNSLPCEYVLYTALESKTEDDDRTTIYGPAISGKKATAQCGAWVGDMIHAQDYPFDRVVRVPDPAKPGASVEQIVKDMVVRFHFKNHLDPVTSILFPAKARVTPEKMAELEKEFPGGYFEPTVEWGFDRYLRKVDELVSSQADTLKGWRDRVGQKIGRSGPSGSGNASPAASKTVAIK
jgi:hypothetical protein